MFLSAERKRILVYSQQDVNFKEVFRHCKNEDWARPA